MMSIPKTQSAVLKASTVLFVTLNKVLVESQLSQDRCKQLLETLDATFTKGTNVRLALIRKRDLLDVAEAVFQEDTRVFVQLLNLLVPDGAYIDITPY